jgi:hypothetical protein
MNRAQRRAQAARDKMAHNADRVRRCVEEARDAAQQGERFRMLLFAVLRREGRLLVHREDIDALHEDDRCDFVVRGSGDVVLEFTAGGPS